MKVTTRASAAAASVLLLLAVSACETQKSSNPLSPSVAGPIAGVDITPPQLLEPGQGFKYKESQQPIRLLVANATTTGVRPLTYTFEVATDNAFATKVFARSGVPQGDGGQTSVTADKLVVGRSYFWRARAEDGANTGTFATAQFEVLPTPQLNPPTPASPINNFRITSTNPLLLINNSDRNSAVGAVTYEFQVAKDAAFASIVASGKNGETGSQSWWVVNPPVAASVQYYWRVRASDGETTSSWTATQGFLGPVPTAPAPSPAPSPAPGGPCSGTPLAIVTCERNKYGFMSPSQTLDFERAVARDLNAAGIPEGPFGILRKSGGSSCNGYSCDIICSGQGSAQKQWDILGDAEGAQVPNWSGPATAPNIRQDVCEIQ